MCWRPTPLERFHFARYTGRHQNVHTRNSRMRRATIGVGQRPVEFRLKNFEEISFFNSREKSTEFPVKKFKNSSHPDQRPRWCIGGGDAHPQWAEPALRNVEDAVCISTQETQEYLIPRLRLGNDPSNFDTRISRHSRFFILEEKKKEFLLKKFKK